MSSSSSSQQQQLNYLNYGNLIAYVLNTLVTYGIGALGLFGAKSNSELSSKYQTLVTPIGFAFAIWGIIFTFQLIFCIVQFVIPSYRSLSYVQEGVYTYYIGVCLSQIVWTILFSFEYILSSAILMLIILFFLSLIVTSQYELWKKDLTTTTSTTSTTTSKYIQYWILQFPFSIHCGWIIAASFVNVSVVLVKFSATAELQLGVAIASLVGIVTIAIVALITVSDYVIPCVLVWATYGIWKELGTPNELIVTTFTSSTIDVVRGGACATSAFISLSVGIVLLRQLITQFRNRDPSASAEEAVYLRVNNNATTTTTTIS